MKNIQKALCVMLLSLSGCASSSVPVARPMLVEVPVAVPCSAPVVDHPIWPLGDLPSQSTIYDQARLALAEIELREAYETKLRAAIESCR